MGGNRFVMKHRIRAAGRIQSVTSCKTCKGATRAGARAAVLWLPVDARQQLVAARAA